MRRDEAGRWEIFHDVLAGAVLGWKGRHDAERAVAQARAEGRRRHRRLAFLTFGALVALAAMTALASFAFSQRSEAREQARSARSGQLVASALAALDSDPELGIALALEAARTEPTVRAEDALRQALDASRVRAVIRTGHPVVGMDVDPSRPRVLVVGDDGVARLYALDTGRLRWSHRVDGGAAAFVRDGRDVGADRRLARSSCSMRRPAHRAGRPSPVTLPGVVEELVPSPDGSSAIALVGKPRARVISLSSGAWLGRVKHPRVVTDAAFSPDGRLVVSSGRDRVGRVWSTTSWTEIMDPLRGHVGQVLAVAFDRSGPADRRRGAPTRPRGCWRVRDRPAVHDPVRACGVCQRRRLRARGGVIVTASSDGTAMTWLAEGVPARILRGHRGPVRKADVRCGRQRCDRRRGRDRPDLGPGDEHRSRACVTLPRRRAFHGVRLDLRTA